MGTIDITDLPEPLARAVETMVNGLREQVAKKNGSTTQPIELPKWKGKVIGTLSREEIYEDAV